MGDVMAIISQAAFGELCRSRGEHPQVGQVLDLDRYDSAAPGLRPLTDGGSLFLVTVRPPEQLWLIAILEAPRFASHWSAKPNITPIRNITALRAQLRFASGKGVSMEPGRLGMSLQTPRVLTADDVSLLRGDVATRQSAPAPRPAEGRRSEQSAPLPAGPVAATALNEASEQAGPDHAPRFENAERYWQIERRGAEIMTWFGVLGHKARTRARTFPEVRQAKLEAARMMEDKRRDGYRLRERPTPAVLPALRGVCARNAALEAMIEADPDNLDAYFIYGDWLEEQRDARGALIAAQRARLANPDSAMLAHREEEVLSTYAAELLGPLARFRGPSNAMRAFHFHAGFIERARFHRRSAKPRLDELLRLFFAHPSSRFVRHITLGPADFTGDRCGYQSALEVIATDAPSTLVSLHIGESARGLGNLGDVFVSLPRLERLTVGGNTDVAVGGNTHVAAALRELDVPVVWAHAPPVLCRHAFPRLEHLRLTFHGGTPDGRLWNHICAERFPKLRRLGLRFTSWEEQFVPLRDAPLLARLRHLDLAVATLPKDREAFLNGATRFEHLDHLHIHDRCRLPFGWLARMQAALPKLEIVDIPEPRPFEDAAWRAQS